MSDDVIGVKQLVLVAYKPVTLNGQSKFELNYFKWGPNNDLCISPDIKGAAIFKPQEIERTIKLLQASNFAYRLQAQPVK